MPYSQRRIAQSKGVAQSRPPQLKIRIDSTKSRIYTTQREAHDREERQARLQVELAQRRYLEQVSEAYFYNASSYEDEADSLPPELFNDEARLQGTYILGQPGTGKSTLVTRLIRENIQNGRGVCVLDVHRSTAPDKPSLTESTLSCLPRHRLNEVILLDIRDQTRPFGLNVLNCLDPSDDLSFSFTFNQVMHVFLRLFGIDSSKTPMMANILRKCIATLIYNPGYTLAEIPLLLQDADFRSNILAHVHSPLLRLFWETYESKNSEERRQAYSVVDKVEAFLDNPLISHIIGQSQTTIKFDEVLDEHKILIVQLDPLQEDMTNLVGSLIISLLLRATYSRKKVNEPFFLYADEFQNFAAMRDFAQMWAEARKYGLAVTLSHQFTHQLDEYMKAATLIAANKVFFRIGRKDAEAYAGEFDTTFPPAEEIEETSRGWRERPMKSPVRNPLDWLLSGHGRTHPNPLVEQFLMKWKIRGYAELYRRGAGREASSTPEQGEYSHIGTERDRELLSPILNDLFYEAMEGVQTGTDVDIIDRLLDLARALLPGHFMPHQSAVAVEETSLEVQETSFEENLVRLNLQAQVNYGQLREEDKAKLKESLIQEMQAWLEKLQEQWYIVKLKESYCVIGPSDDAKLRRGNVAEVVEFADLEGAHQEFMKVFKPVHASLPQLSIPVSDTWYVIDREKFYWSTVEPAIISRPPYEVIECEKKYVLGIEYSQDDLEREAEAAVQNFMEAQGDQTMPTPIQEGEIERVMEFIADLVEVMHVFAEEPIEVDTGRTVLEEDIRTHTRRLPEKSHADMYAGIVNELTHLPNFRGKMKTPYGEGYLEVKKQWTEVDGLYVSQYREWLLQNQRGGVTRDREEVEQSMRDRQEGANIANQARQPTDSQMSSPTQKSQGPSQPQEQRKGRVAIGGKAVH